MLEDWFKTRRTLFDFRRGPLGPYFDGFAARLKEHGYHWHTGCAILAKACQFNVFLIDKGVSDCKQISRDLIDPFLDVFHRDFRTTCPDYSPRGRSQGELNRLFCYLEEAGVLKPVPRKPVPRRYGKLLDPYARYLRNECELSEATVKQCYARAEEFLASLGKKAERKTLRGMGADVVEAHIKRFLKRSPQNLRRLTYHLRRFLRYCAEKGYTTSDFSGIFPSVPSFRSARLPRGMEDSEVQRILNAVPKDKRTGARDYAMILLMMAYGLRAKSVAELLLEDVNWERSTIRIRARKGGKEVVLPLLGAVAEAIVRYLGHRGQSEYRNIFLTVKAMRRPLNSVVISRTVSQCMVAAGVKKPGRGAYSLRHSWAIRALAHGSPIKSIADVLGHRSVETSFIYAKADLKTLRDVVMPWPERR